MDKLLYTAHLSTSILQAHFTCLFYIVKKPLLNTHRKTNFHQKRHMHDRVFEYVFCFWKFNKKKITVATFEKSRIYKYYFPYCVCYSVGFFFLRPIHMPRITARQDDECASETVTFNSNFIQFMLAFLGIDQTQCACDEPCPSVDRFVKLYIYRTYVGYCFSRQ